MFKKFTIACATALVMTSAICSAETLRVGTEPSAVPLSFLDAKTNKVEGLMLDVLAEVAKDAKFDIAVQPAEFSSLLPALTSNKIDIISAAMFATAKRAEVVDFTDIVYSYGEGLFVSGSDATAYKSFDDLKGEAVGAQIGTVYLDGLKASGKFSDVKSYDSVMAIMMDVNAGRIKAGFGDYPIIAYQLSKGNFPKTHLVSTYQPTMQGSVAMSIRKGQPELLARINASLAKIKTDGRMDTILKKWGL